MYPAFRSTSGLRHAQAMIICKIKAVFIYPKMNKARVVWLLAITLTLRIISGIVSGIVSNSVDYGLKCGVVLFPFMAAVEAFVFRAFG